MPHYTLRLVSGAVATAAVLVCSPASASLVYLPAENALFQGSGLGTVNTVLTLTSPGSSSTEAGAVFAVGAGVGTSGDAAQGISQFGLPSLGALGLASTTDLRLILNATEPSGNSITVSQLTLNFYDMLGASLASFVLGEPVTLASTLTGIGQAGFVFGLDAAQAAAAATAIANSGTPLADVRVGLAARLTDATGGPETFFIGSARPAVAALVPEPAVPALLAAGLGLVALTKRRRRN